MLNVECVNSKLMTGRAGVGGETTLLVSPMCFGKFTGLGPRLPISVSIYPTRQCLPQQSAILPRAAPGQAIPPTSRARRRSKEKRAATAAAPAPVDEKRKETEKMRKKAKHTRSHQASPRHTPLHSNAVPRATRSGKPPSKEEEEEEETKRLFFSSQNRRKVLSTRQINSLHIPIIP